MNDDHVHRLDLNLLTIFDAVMTERSLTKAGERLGVTQSAVSHAVSRLRDVTGDPLFQRTGRGVKPTPRASEIAADVRAALDLLRSSLRTSPRDFSCTTSERAFRLEIPAGMDCIVLPPLVERMSGCRNLSLRVSGGRANDVMNELRYGEAWLAIDAEVVSQAGFCCQLLFEDPIVAISRRGHAALCNGVTRKALETLEHAAIGMAGEHAATPVGHLLSRYGIRRKVRCTVPNIATLPAVVAQSDLIALISEKMARALQPHFEIDIHGIAPDAMAGNVPLMPVFMVWHECFDADEGHIWLRETLKSVCEDL